jgi:type III restriction enzyme
MNDRVQNHVTGRLSLRSPQAESLARLKQLLEAVPEMLTHERDVAGRK